MSNDTTLADALDGLQDAERYCASRGLDDLSEQVAELYQRVGENAPDEDWTGGRDE